MLEANSFFTNMVDELVEFSEYDPELAEGLKWIDGEAQKRGITFYEMVFHVLHRYDTDARAKDWLANRN
ncbi:MAG: hypothetical protein KGH89_05355 [Thaumarchaeota archaeon]|nr:hypothetical protein [Nitrososphaerota archaeon]MDE1866234.1 hypothetical protein [Nitrososphaerota archaeon]